MSDVMEHAVNLHGRLPEFMLRFREMKALLDAEKPEFEELRAGLEAALEDFFIQTASAAAVARYEAIMDIRPAPGDSLKTRRLRLLLAVARIERFTVARLIEIAAQLGEVVEVELLSGHRIALDFIAADAENIEILYDEFRSSLPAHLEMIVRNVLEQAGQACVGGTMGQSAGFTFVGV